MRTVRAKVAYLGGKFFGWQRQDGFWSVQEAIEEACLGLLGEKTTVFGAGRTDTGVHALGQVAHFHVDTRLEDERLRRALNAHLGEGVSLRALETCREDFHARFDARRKRYAYQIATGTDRPLHGAEYAHWIPQPLDLTAMRSAARDLVGEHDFRAFGNAGSVRKTTVRTLSGARLVRRGKRLWIVVQANGFLYKMVRTIAGTLIDVGRHRLDSGCVAQAIASGDREDLGPTAPPEGLFLLSVAYREPLFRNSTGG